MELIWEQLRLDDTYSQSLHPPPAPVAIRTQLIQGQHVHLCSFSQVKVTPGWGEKRTHKLISVYKELEHTHICTHWSCRFSSTAPCKTEGIDRWRAGLSPHNLRAVTDCSGWNLKTCTRSDLKDYEVLCPGTFCHAMSCNTALHPKWSQAAPDWLRSITSLLWPQILQDIGLSCMESDLRVLSP